MSAIRQQPDPEVTVLVDTAQAEAPAQAIEDVARPGSDRAAAIRALRTRLSLLGDTGEGALERAEHLVGLAERFGSHPFTPLEQARRLLGVDRAAFAATLDLFGRIPELATAVQRAPEGKYWTNTILPLERTGALDAVVHGRPAFPYSVGLYPGPTCMFRCHFCVRVTGARYDASVLDEGNAMFASVIDEVPDTQPSTVYFSGGLEPLTNPGLGELAARGGRRGLDMTLYTNAFALTDRTLERQPGLWSLHAIRTSLYGLNDTEYEATTTKPRAFRRVKENLGSFMAERAARQAPLRLGLNYIVLPGRADRLMDLVDFVAELNEHSPGRPLDFVTVREDYSGRDDGRLAADERTQLRDALRDFTAYAAERTPALNIDLGYALESLRAGVDAELLRITPQTMRGAAHPQVAVQVDLLGDVYLYRESGFPELEGARRYIAGRVTPTRSLHDVVREFVERNPHIEPRPGDEYFLDGFDQVVTARLNQLEQDIADGWAAHRGLLGTGGTA
ncbi:dTDP-4-amino-4,6-dideoxy-D-glucose ammonia-lyase [Streptomyces cellostaticus]|uniref:dTDP-4-amino-4,6-dideoxy-D-glucose ammonia-lyase n=1 Tax=Streptomyces cellostaticus TaxID=67285 RepID=UPI00099EDA03|nr:dTDP-4-amino-4,6-dideoxy-D-glucose ammonia-lyase [Streptomyces cellostaticus]